MSNLEKHAESEMRRAGLFDKDADYDGMIPAAVMKLVQTHAAEGHSGSSHALTLAIFNKVINFQTLTPITSDPSEWMRVDPDHYQPGTWQNIRQGTCFSRDAGKSWYNIDLPETLRTCLGCKTHFPATLVDCPITLQHWYCSEECQKKATYIYVKGHKMPSPRFCRQCKKSFPDEYIGHNVTEEVWYCTAECMRADTYD
jgi:hypothetical protein